VKTIFKYYFMKKYLQFYTKMVSAAMLTFLSMTAFAQKDAGALISRATSETKRVGIMIFDLFSVLLGIGALIAAAFAFYKWTNESQDAGKSMIKVVLGFVAAIVVMQLIKSFAF